MANSAATLHSEGRRFYDLPSVHKGSCRSSKWTDNVQLTTGDRPVSCSTVSARDGLAAGPDLLARLNGVNVGARAAFPPPGLPLIV